MSQTRQQPRGGQPAAAPDSGIFTHTSPEGTNTMTSTKPVVVDIALVAAEIGTMFAEIKKSPKIGQNLATAINPRMLPIQELLTVTARGWATPAAAGETA